MHRPHQPSSLDNWNVPPPTDGPNARARRARGESLYSGTSAPLPLPAMMAQQQYQKNVHSADEWKEWQRVQQGGENGQWASERHYQRVQPTLVSTSQQPYYQLDSSLPFPSQPDLQRSHCSYPDAPTPQLYEPALTPSPQHWEERQRQASSATVIDHGSPPSSPTVEELPELREEMLEAPALFSKEEWLRLGGFAPLEAKARSTALLPRYQPVQAPAANAETGWTELPSPRYSFPSTLQPFNPADVPYSHSQPPPPSPYDLPPLPPLPELPPLPAPSPFPSVANSRPFAQSDLRSTSIGGGMQGDLLVADANASCIPLTPRSRTRTRTAPSSTPGRSNRTAPYPSQSASSSVTPPHSNTFDLSLGASTLTSNPPPSLPPLNEHRKSHARKRSIGHVSRPRKAFILFRSHAVSSNLIPREMGIKNEKNISQVVASVWRNLAPEEKKHWELLAQEEKRVHKEKYPDYVFKPKAKGPRKPVGQGKKALAKKAKIKQEEEDSDDDDILFDDEEEYVPRPTRTGRSHKAKTTGAPEPFSPNKLPEVTARRMQLVGEALAEGEQMERIEDRVKLEIDLEQEMGIAPPPKAGKARYPRRRQPLNVQPAALPLPPSNPSTPRKTRSFTRPAPYTSPSSDILVNSPASSTSTASPSRDHSFRQTRLAKRGGTSTWKGKGDDSSALSSSSNSPQRQQQAESGTTSPVKSPLSQSVTSQRSSKGYGQLGLASSNASSSTNDDAHRPPPFAFPSFDFGKSPFLAGRAFDNSPLLGGSGADRKSSLGRWELRKPSMTMSGREMMAQEEEETMELGAVGGGRTVSKAFTIDPHLFLAEAGLEEEADYTTNYLPSQPPLPPHFSTTTASLKPSPPTSAYAKHASYALPPVEYHFGGQDLFSAPSNDLFGGKMTKGRNGSGGSPGSGGAGGQPSAMDFGLQLDERGSTYSAETSLADTLDSYQ